MASSSALHRAARAPTPDRLASFYRLVDKKVIAGVLGRYARQTELSASAALEAEALFGVDSLVVANLRMDESHGLTDLALEATGVERDVLLRRSWAVLLTLIPLLKRRLEANTLLPGTMREEELDFTAHLQAAIKKAKNLPALSPAGLRAMASAMGYNTLIDALIRGLDMLPLPLWPATQKRGVESFVLQGLDVIPLTASIPPAWVVQTENALVTILEQYLKPQNCEPGFHTARGGLTGLRRAALLYN